MKQKRITKPIRIEKSIHKALKQTAKKEGRTISKFADEIFLQQPNVRQIIKSEKENTSYLEQLKKEKWQTKRFIKRMESKKKMSRQIRQIISELKPKKKKKRKRKNKK